MASYQTISVTGISILEKGKWPFLKAAIERVIRDTKLKKMIIVSNVEAESAELNLYAKFYAGKMIVREMPPSSGHAELFASLIELAKAQSTDYVLYLDDDAIPEDNLIDGYLQNFKFFKEEQVTKSILIANTIDIFGKEKSFYSSATKKSFKDGTLFDVLSPKKIMTFFKRKLGFDSSPLLPPVFETQAFIGGGAFIPMEALQKAKAPNPSLYMYGEDNDYAWKLRESGYSFFQCTSPIIRKPSSEIAASHHVFGLFDERTPAYKVYYHIRNAVLVSREHTYQSGPVLFANIIIWLSLALLAGLWETTSFRHFFSKVKIVLIAAVHGYRANAKRPSFITIP